MLFHQFKMQMQMNKQQQSNQFTTSQPHFEQQSHHLVDETEEEEEEPLPTPTSKPNRGRKKSVAKRNKGKDVEVEKEIKEGRIRHAWTQADELLLAESFLQISEDPKTGSSTTHQSSISEKIIHKLASRNKKTSYVYQNSYHELEAAYVAQICLTWEALNWNYNYFQQLRASRRESDPGCPAYIAQQFQQFQVVLQRYIENEPYQNGRRPIVFARMRSIAPKLLQVPEYRDTDDEKKDEYLGSRISSESFLKKLKLKYLRRLHKCFRKRKSKQVNEMEVLMAQIDLKIVSRVLRTSDLNEEQLRWCEDKMTKVKVCDMKLQSDSSPLFFSPLFFTLPRH
ncbi:ribosomal protein L34Ae protein [Tanacetum coccineum]